MSLPRLRLSKCAGFPEKLEDNGKISTLKFIEASNEVIGIMESFGKFFTPVVSDMRGNTSQLLAVYQKDVEKYKYLEDMILCERGNCSAHLWLLWLKRALELIEKFFEYVMTDPDVINQKTDNLQPMIKRAYNEVLKVKFNSKSVSPEIIL